MKLFNLKSSILGLAVLLLGVFQSCDQLGGGKAEFSVTIQEVGSDYVNLQVVAKGIGECAYILTEEPQEEFGNATTIFMAEQYMTFAEDGIFTITGLAEKTDYTFYAAAQAGDDYYPEVVMLEFTTAAYNFDELLTIVDTYYDGYKLHITLPQETKDRGNAIRFNQSDIMMYNYSSKYMQGTDYSATLYNGGRFWTNEDKTFIFNEENCYFEDEEGYTDSYYDPISPGQPVVVVAAEYAWMTEETDGNGFYFPAGWEDGYYLPLLDPSYGTKASEMAVEELTDFDITSDMDAYWTGAFQKKVFTVKQPELLDGTVKVEVSEVGPVNAKVTFTPDDNVYQYAYSILDSESYNQMLSLCGGHEKYLQWAITSYFGAYTFGCSAGKGPLEITLKDLFFTVGEQSKYRILVTAMGDQMATSQSFATYEFYTTEKVMGTPVVEVTALEDESTPYSAAFNVKAPNKDLAYAYYAANYKKDWVLAVNGGSTYFNLVAGNYPFTADEIAQINSDEGLTLRFPTVDGETTRLVVVGYNAEDTPNNLNYEDITECPAVADCTTDYADPKPYVESTLFEDLVGDWTATAKILVNNNEIDYSAKVNIASAIEGYPETLTDDVYALYEKAGWTKDQTDGYFEEFKYLAEEFSENRLEFQNRLLCQGWIDYDSYDRLDLRTPYDLFVAEDYSAVDVSSIFFDFGPKWYLEVEEGDKLSIPMDTYFLPPVSNWSIPYYLAAFSSETNYAITDGNSEQAAKFTVTLSDDKNTLTINPMEVDGVKYYPNLIGNDAQFGTILEAPVVSPIVLTRGWTEKKSQMSASGAAPIKVNAELPDVVYKSLTRFPNQMEYQKIEGSVMTIDKLMKNFEKFNEQLKNRNN